MRGPCCAVDQAEATLAVSNPCWSDRDHNGGLTTTGASVETHGELDLYQSLNVVPPLFSFTVVSLRRRHPIEFRAQWQMLLLLCGWLAATGAHWDVVQVAAWGRMWAQNLRSESATAALARTFSPEGMCSVCHAVQAAKQAQREGNGTVGPLLEKAPLLPLNLSRTLLDVPAVSGFVSQATATRPGAVFREPPVPPPRALAV